MGTWFDKERGINSGRITPTAVEPADGIKLFMLGQEYAIEPAEISVGDFTSVKQVIDLTGFDFVEATFETIGKSNGSTGTKWVQQILINSIVYAERTIVADEQRTWTDFIAPVRKLKGKHDVEFRLILDTV